MGKRGRPKQEVNETEFVKPMKFIREYKSKNGGRSVWTYDLNKAPNGPISIEEFYPTNFVSEAEIEAKLPKTQRKYINPKNGKLVAYSRAKELGIVK
jgi:hypothetical protein